MLRFWHNSTLQALSRDVKAWVSRLVRSVSGVIRVTDAVAANARAVVVEGDAWVRNQLVQNGDFADGTTGWTLQNVSATAEGNVATITYEESSTNKNINQTKRMKLQPGHTYCIRIDIADAPNGMVAIVSKSAVYAVTGSQWHTYSSVVAVTSVTYCYFAVYNSGTSATVRVRNIMCVDLTQLCNGDAAKIAAITSWADLVAQYPEYASYVAYNAGEVVWLQSALTTGVWNQLVSYGSFSSGTTGWDGVYGTISAADGVLTYTVSAVKAQDVNRLNQYSRNIVAGHVYLAHWEIKTPYAQTTSISAWGTAVSNSTIARTTASTVANAWTSISLMVTGAYSASSQLRVGIWSVNNTAVGDQTYIRNVQLIDLTLLFGPGHEPTNVQEVLDYCAAIGHSLAQCQAYDAGTPLGGTASTQTLYAAGTAHDTQDVVSGEVTRRIGAYTFTASDAWNKYTGYSANGWSFTVPGKALGNNVMLVGYDYVSSVQNLQYNDYSVCGNGATSAVYIRDVGYLSTTATKQEFAAHMAGKTIYYELATPTTSTVTAQPLALQKGSNSIYQTDAGRTASFEMTYAVPIRSASTNEQTDNDNA